MGPVLGTELISFGTTASAIALGSQIYSTTTIYAKRSDDYDSLSPNQQCGYRAMKLRAERNWWISALAVPLAHAVQDLEARQEEQRAPAPRGQEEGRVGRPVPRWCTYEILQGSLQ